MDKTERILLLCLDLESGSEELVRIGAGYAGRLGLRLHILYVLPASSAETGEDAVTRLKGVIEGVSGAAALTPVVRRGRVEEEIVNYVRERAVEMIILGHRHGARRERVHVGSTTRTVISLAPGPVLVVPIDSERE